MTQKTTLNKHNALYALGIFLLITGALYGIKIVFDFAKISSFQSSGIETVAIVTDLHDTNTVFVGGTYNKVYSVGATYSTDNGSIQTVDLSVDPGSYKSLSEGEQTKILYQSDQPDKAVLKSSIGVFQRTFYKRALMIVIALVLGALFCVKGKKSYLADRQRSKS